MRSFNRYSFSGKDSEVFTALPSVPCQSEHPHAYRWYIHIAALKGIPAVVAAAKPSAGGAKGKAAAPAKKAAKPADDDDVDLFGDDVSTSPHEPHTRVSDHPHAL
jgi:elongation factor 1-beta